MEANSTENSTLDNQTIIFSPEQFLEHWQGHRGLTRRVIEAFPEDKLLTYSIGGMRTFADLSMEILGMTAPGIRGIAFGDWSFDDPQISFNAPTPASKQELLAHWDKVTELLNSIWPQIPPQRFQEHDVAFGEYAGPVYGTLLYIIDNEIHHRGQGYVYLRSLGIEPPAFWDR
jgi:uncharacterized damage-inducible protein DinB